jgi:hypothetical protein
MDKSLKRLFIACTIVKGDRELHPESQNRNYSIIQNQFEDEPAPDQSIIALEAESRTDHPPEKRVKRFPNQNQRMSLTTRMRLSC